MSNLEALGDLKLLSNIRAFHLWHAAYPWRRNRYHVDAWLKLAHGLDVAQVLGALDTMKPTEMDADWNQQMCTILWVFVHLFQMDAAKTLLELNFTQIHPDWAKLKSFYQSPSHLPAINWDNVQIDQLPSLVRYYALDNVDSPYRSQALLTITQAIQQLDLTASERLCHKYSGRRLTAKYQNDFSLMDRYTTAVLSSTVFQLQRSVVEIIRELDGKIWQLVQKQVVGVPAALCYHSFALVYASTCAKYTLHPDDPFSKYMLHSTLHYQLNDTEKQNVAFWEKNLYEFQQTLNVDTIERLLRFVVVPLVQQYVSEVSDAAALEEENMDLDIFPTPLVTLDRETFHKPWYHNYEDDTDTFGHQFWL